MTIIESHVQNISQQVQRLGIAANQLYAFAASRAQSRREFLQTACLPRRDTMRAASTAPTRTKSAESVSRKGVFQMSTKVMSRDERIAATAKTQAEIDKIHGLMQRCERGPAGAITRFDKLVARQVRLQVAEGRAPDRRAAVQFCAINSPEAHRDFLKGSNVGNPAAEFLE